MNLVIFSERFCKMVIPNDIDKVSGFFTPNGQFRQVNCVMFWIAFSKRNNILGFGDQENGLIYRNCLNYKKSWIPHCNISNS